MRILLIPALVVLTALPTFGQNGDTKAPELKTNRDKVGYTIGRNIGDQFQRQGMDVDPKVVALGIASVLNGDDNLLAEEDIQALFSAYSKEQAEKNKQEAKDFLTANAKKAGVKKTKSGLQYLVLKEGTGDSPKESHTVHAHYRGTFINGRMFDQSYTGTDPTEDDKPAQFGVTQVIAGWTEALQLMKVGAKYRLFIPPELAYGDRPRDGIPVNSLLIFELELVKTVPGDKVIPLRPAAPSAPN